MEKGSRNLMIGIGNLHMLKWNPNYANVNCNEHERESEKAINSPKLSAKQSFMHLLENMY
jgi:hypothetical protein